MLSNLRVPFGQRGSRLYAAKDVQRGLDCGCHCPKCGARLIANHPKIKRHYFSHHQAKDCPGGYETAIHLMAKQILLDYRWVRTPGKTVELIERHYSEIDELTDQVSYPERDLQLTEIVSEQKEERWRPDLTATLRNGATLFIEIKVTHGVHEEKMVDLDNLLEIDLSKVKASQLSDTEVFAEIVLRSAPRDWHRCSLYDNLERTETNRKRLRTRAEAQYQRWLEATKQERAMADEERRVAANRRQKAKADQKAKFHSRQLIKPLLEQAQKEQRDYLPLPSKGTPSDWRIEGEEVFAGHRSEWQGMIHRTFVYGRPINSVFSVNDVVRHVCANIPLAPAMAGLMKHRQILTAEELDTIRTPDDVIAKYLFLLGLSAYLQPGAHDGTYVVIDRDQNWDPSTILRRPRGSGY